MYDFDKTLSPKDMQEFHYIRSLGYEDPSEFWKECGVFSQKHNCDGILSYMYLMAAKNPGLTKKQLLEEGKYVELYRGVNTWFERINAYGKKHHVNVEHYVISSGLTDIIKGTSIAKQFKKIYACTYAYDEKGRILWPSRVVNYTMKTQYLFRINKGVLTETNDEDLNSSTPEAEKYIPLENMVYFGDGSTDVPSMKVVQQNGGTTIAVFGDDSKRKNAEKLFEDKRATFFVKADYSKGSRIEKIVEGIIDSLEVKNRLEDYR
ncbi:MAG: haloacid dehalogenase-like hydrolase [Erysipelotrichaceae bacterium]|nr:haloacid dehalogenase-like hydrolase [Erysipelotrichaceae bacterium]